MKNISKPDMKGKICIITGANSGIGKATALKLAELGAHVVMICRNEQKGLDAKKEIEKKTGSTLVDLLIADLSSFSNIKQLALQIQCTYSKLDVLINNAGVRNTNRQITQEGIEMTFAINHLGYFFLTILLLDLIKMSAPSRIINVSSSAQMNASIDLDDPEYKHRHYRGYEAYAQSKLMNILFTKELARRLFNTGVTINCLHPGEVATNIMGDYPKKISDKVLWIIWRIYSKYFHLSPKEGAKTSIYLASSPDVMNVSGEYFVNCKPAPINLLGDDKNIATKLWELSEKYMKNSYS
jgi:NAD(P)-dependent dehydrogenase (short-subunit alcohol dehydrogenase family)